MLTLTDKVTIIAGGGTGIGKATAELFANEGTKLILLGRREAPLKETSKETGASYYQCDVCDEARVEEIVKKIENSYDHIDILVNSAGVHKIEGLLTDLEEKVIDEILRVNIKGTLLLSKHVLKKMRQQKYGNIVNIGSILGVIGAENVTAYTASKGAIIAMTRAMAIENAPYGIRVNCVSPSIVETDMIKKALEADSQFKRRMMNAHPSKRLLTAREVARTILYLASDSSSFINGQNILVDAGRSVYDR